MIGHISSKSDTFLVTSVVIIITAIFFLILSGLKKRSVHSAAVSFFFGCSIVLRFLRYNRNMIADTLDGWILLVTRCHACS